VKLFVDANILISGLLFQGNELLLLELGRYGTCELVTIDYVREEVADFLGRPQVHLSEEEQRRLMVILDRSVVAYRDPPEAEVREALGRLRDEDDLPVLVGFERSGADHLVTGDRELRSPTPKAVRTRRALELLLGEFE
jgi:predicted nucleic acid-binding protein